MVEIVVIEKLAYEIARTTRNTLLGIPDRIATLLTSITDQGEIHSILTKEIRQGIEEIIHTLENIEEAQAQIQVQMQGQ